MNDVLQITGLTQAGHGYLRHDDKTLTLPFTAPGDEVEIADGTELRLRARISDLRQKPPCSVFGRCGGCRLQHINDAFVADWKRSAVVAALEGAGLSGAMVEPTRTVPAASRRRAKFALQRTKKAYSFGFYAHGTHNIIHAPDCVILATELRNAMPALAELALSGASRKSPLAITATLSETGLDVSVEDGKEPDLELRSALAAKAEAADIARLVWNGELIAERRPPVQPFGKARVAPPPGAFLQASPDMERIALGLIREEIGPAKRLADLFCGCGTFTLPLLEQASVTAVDADAAMVAAMEAGWRKAEGLKQLDATARDLFRRPLRAEEMKTFDAVIFDPPRAGAIAQARELAGSIVPLVIGISCNPVTFARDARALTQGGYVLTRVVPVDQFRWSAHTEVIGVFRRPV